MRCVLVLALLFACSDRRKHGEAITLVAIGTIHDEAALVTGTRRVALRSREGWWEAKGGTLEKNVELGAAVAREVEKLGELAEVHLGTTPIVIGGEHHHETHVRITPAPVDIEFDGIASKIETTRDGREVWLYEHELDKHVAIAMKPVPPLALIGPPAESASPVSARMCAKPKVLDIAVSEDTVYALVGECNDEAPLRLVTFEPAAETRLPSREELGIAFEKLVVSKTGAVHIVAVRGGKLAIVHVTGGKVTSETFGPITRVVTAVATDDNIVWALVLDADGKTAVVRDGKAITSFREPTMLGFDETLGATVLDKATNGYALYVERATMRWVNPPP